MDWLARRSAAPGPVARERSNGRKAEHAWTGTQHREHERKRMIWIVRRSAAPGPVARERSNGQGCGWGEHASPRGEGS